MLKPKQIHAFYLVACSVLDSHDKGLNPNLLLYFFLMADLLDKKKTWIWMKDSLHFNVRVENNNIFFGSVALRNHMYIYI